jgi:predicted sulfurtransferase
MLGKNHDDSNRNDDKNYDNVNSKVVKSLGSWFPSATIYKVDFDYYNNKTITICLFYQYIIPNWNHKQLNNIMKLIQEYIKLFNIGGRIRIANEGINATITSDDDNIKKFITKLIEYDDIFNQTNFKYIEDLTIDRAFKDIKIIPVKELVYYGIQSNHDNDMSQEGGMM